MTLAVFGIGESMAEECDQKNSDVSKEDIATALGSGERASVTDQNPCFASLMGCQHQRPSKLWTSRPLHLNCPLSSSSLLRCYQGFTRIIRKAQEGRICETRVTGIPFDMRANALFRWTGVAMLEAMRRSVLAGANKRRKRPAVVTWIVGGKDLYNLMDCDFHESRDKDGDYVMYGERVLKSQNTSAVLPCTTAALKATRGAVKKRCHQRLVCQIPCFRAGFDFIIQEHGCCCWCKGITKKPGRPILPSPVVEEASLTTRMRGAIAPGYGVCTSASIFYVSERGVFDSFIYSGVQHNDDASVAATGTGGMTTHVSED
ncbi:hypothetical protein R1flu_020634 [Riccia fluitans]|uniref:Uncharacterized protein n=1 Tax=Riccia fluitans TaxID=41844 RepID=A0ABD1ZP59_9MARC